MEIAPVLKRHWLLIPGCLVVTLASTAFLTLNQQPTYRSSATLIVGPAPQIVDVDEIVDSLNTLDRRSVLATYAEIPSSRTVRYRTYESLGLNSVQRRGYSIRSRVAPDTNIIQVSVEGPEADRCAEIANQIAAESQSYNESFYGIYGMEVLDEAQPSNRIIRPSMSRNLGIGLILGTFIGVAAALALELVRTSRSTTSAQIGD